MEGDGTFEKVKEFVRQEMEERGREQPIALDEISRALGINEEHIWGELSKKIVTGELVGMDLFVTFTD